MGLPDLPSFTGPFAVIANEGSNDATLIDIPTGTVARTIPLGGSGRGAAVSEDGSTAYVNTSAGTRVIDLATSTITATLGIAGFANLTLSPDGSLLLIPQLQFDNLKVVDTGTDAVLATIPVGDGPWDVAVSPDGARALVTNLNSDDISIVDLSSSTVTGTIPLGAGASPAGIGIRPDGRKAYVSSDGTATVKVIDLTTDMLVGSIFVGVTPQHLRVDAHGNFAYVSRQSANAVTVLDVQTDQLVTHIGTGSFPQAVGITPDGAQLYVANRGSHDVSIIDMATNSVTSTVAVGTFPVGVGMPLVPPVPPAAQADLSVTKSDAVDPVTVGDDIVYTVTVTNGGPDEVTGVTMIDVLPAGVTHVSASPSQGSCGETSGTVTCDLGSLANGDGVTVTLTVTADQAGQVSNTADVTANEADPDLSNNSGTESTTVDASAAVQVMISSGNDYSCGVTTAGAAYCWGNNTGSQLGDGTNTASNVPVPVSGGLTFQSVSAGQQSHSCGATTAGAAYCWGTGSDGQLGNGTNTASNVPVPVSGMLTFQSVSAGQAHSCGVTTAGEAYCWGKGGGALGNGTNTNRSEPWPVSGGLTFRSVTTGQVHSCGVTTAGDGYCWGAVLGNGTNTVSNVPVGVDPPF